MSLVSGRLLLCESRDAWEAQAASRQELEQRPWLCWRLQGARLEIKPNKNVWFVAFIFGRCQLQFELARCLEAGWVTNIKDALMNCWQSSVSSLIRYMMARKTSTHCYTEVWPRLMLSVSLYNLINQLKKEGHLIYLFIHLLLTCYESITPLCFSNYWKNVMLRNDMQHVNAFQCSPAISFTYFYAHFEVSH